VDVLTSPFAAASGVILAVLGARRRVRRPDGSGPTVGQQVTTIGRATSTQAVHMLSGVSRLGWNLGAGVVEVGGVTAAMTIRTASHISDRVSSKVFVVAGSTAATAGGLVVDGVASIGDLMQAPFRGAR
jgi:hypothetical protein